jgi:hypothetical protein
MLELIFNATVLHDTPDFEIGYVCAPEEGTGK